MVFGSGRRFAPGIPPGAGAGQPAADIMKFRMDMPEAFSDNQENKKDRPLQRYLLSG